MLFSYFTELCVFSFFFFFNDTATTEIYTLSLHDALPISLGQQPRDRLAGAVLHRAADWRRDLFREIDVELIQDRGEQVRSEEHTSELQSPDHLVCRLLLEKKKKRNKLLRRRDTVFASATD